MRLKRLEIQGFKSFARPVSLEFGPGITAIVGPPNGSGKSNIADAIRWVLGGNKAPKACGANAWKMLSSPVHTAKDPPWVWRKCVSP